MMVLCVGECGGDRNHSQSIEFAEVKPLQRSTLETGRMQPMAWLTRSERLSGVQLLARWIWSRDTGESRWCWVRDNLWRGREEVVVPLSLMLHASCSMELSGLPAPRGGMNMTNPI